LLALHGWQSLLPDWQNATLFFAHESSLSVQVNPASLQGDARDVQIRGVAVRGFPNPAGRHT
jgi:hypothetical protein